MLLISAPTLEQATAALFEQQQKRANAYFQASQDEFRRETPRMVAEPASYDSFGRLYHFGGAPEQLSAPETLQHYPVADLPVPEKQPLEHSVALIDDEYLALADKLHLDSTAIREGKLERIIADECLHVYDLGKVQGYLNNEVNKLIAAETKEHPDFRNGYHKSIRWDWAPARQCDTSPVAGQVQYQRAIPKPVLLTMDKIASRMPEAQFFVSEIKEYPDPFLAVTVPGSDKMWVLERWDEPNFRS